jgi:hypothetical protein
LVFVSDHIDRLGGRATEDYHFVAGSETGNMIDHKP